MRAGRVHRFGLRVSQASLEVNAAQRVNALRMRVVITKIYRAELRFN
jgi:hypothetical protein